MTTPATPSGTWLIAAERDRQDYDAEHDDGHTEAEIAMAAECYLTDYLGIAYRSVPPPDWPFEAAAWKPSDPVTNLAKAGALIAAEIDRLQRQ